MTEIDTTGKSSNIPKTEGGQIYITIVTVFWSPWNSYDTKRGFVGVKVFYREHALAYFQPQFLGLITIWDFSVQSLQLILMSLKTTDLCFK